MDTNWKPLYRIGGIAALIFIVYSMATFVFSFGFGGPPESVAGVFEMLKTDRIIGLIRLDALTILAIPFYYPLFLSIYIALKKTHPSYTTLAILLAFAGITLFLATPSAFSLIPLSDKYAVATTAAEKAQLLAAGEALLASDMFHATGAMLGGILLIIAELALSVIMLSSSDFGKATAIVGIFTYGLDITHFIVGAFSPQAGVILMVVAGTLYLVWFILVARDLFRLGKVSKNAAELRY
jgi:hypothetical protein